MKTIIRSVTPPIVWNLAKQAKASLRTSEMKEFYSWDTADRAAGSYADEMVNSFRVARWSLNRHRGFVQPIESTMLPTLVAMASRPLEIIDFGGATGSIGEALCQRYPETQYTVVENPTMVRLMRAQSSMRTRFTPDMPAGCDVFFSSGTLQYLPAPYAILREGLKSARVAAVLARNTFSNRTIFRVQKSNLFDNGDGDIPEGYKNSVISYAHQTVNESQVIAVAEEEGFTLTSRIPDDTGLVPHGDEVYGGLLTFVRR